MVGGDIYGRDKRQQHRMMSGEGYDRFPQPRRKSWTLRKGGSSSSGGRSTEAVNTFDGQPRQLSALEAAMSASRMMDEPTNIVIDRLARLNHTPPRRNSKLIVYEWDPVYWLTTTTTALTQGYDLVNYSLISEPPSSSSLVSLLPIQEPLNNNCCPSMYAPGTHSLLLQESSS